MTIRLLVLLLLALPLIRGADDPVVARVNGAEIRESALSAGLPRDLFGRMRQFARRSRLTRLVDIELHRQAMVAAGVAADPAEVARRLAAYEQRPPTVCGCHVYRSFADYLERNLLSRADVEAELANAAALDRLVESAWSRELETTGRAALLAREGPRLRQTHVVLLSIAFPARSGESADRRGPAWERALAARGRLLAGDDPAVVAGDEIARNALAQAGTWIGRIALSEAVAYGFDAARQAALAPGEISEPLPGPMRVQLLRWRPLDDADVLALVREPIADGLRKDLLGRVPRTVEYVDPGLDPAASLRR